MISTQTLLVFTAATLLIAASPGPNTFFVIAQAISSGLGSASLAIVGLALSSVAYLTATVTGLAALMHTWPLVFAAIRLAGVAYLVYLGIRMMMSAGNVHSTGPRRGSQRSPLLQGFLTSFSNPKGILYWSAFLPQFVNRARPATPQLILLGATGTMIEVVVVFVYAGVVVYSRRRVVSQRFSRTIDRAAGLYFVGLAVYFGAVLIAG